MKMQDYLDWLYSERDWFDPEKLEVDRERGRISYENACGERLTVQFSRGAAHNVEKKSSSPDSSTASTASGSV